MNRIKKALADCVKQEPIDYELKAKLDAFSDLKTILFEPERWTVSEHATYFGFFCWGWKYAKKPYAAPVSAKREWVDLTDDEIDLIEQQVYRRTTQKGRPLGVYAVGLVRAVIAAFKEKNK